MFLDISAREGDSGDETENDEAEDDETENDEAEDDETENDEAESDEFIFWLDQFGLESDW